MQARTPLVLGALIRAAVKVTEFERRQMAAARRELGGTRGHGRHQYPAVKGWHPGKNIQTLASM
jgi:hypothetical protein